MSWHKEWQSIQICIAEFSTICNEHVAALGVNASESYRTVGLIIIPMANDIASRITEHGKRYSAQLSEPAVTLLEEFKANSVPFIAGLGDNSNTAKLPSTIAHISTLFRRFKSDFNYLTSDLEGIVLRLTARGFSHLQRSIVADESIQKKWIAAYKKGETACEKLGAVHLLQHGIWSAKINSTGERTDLVLGEPLSSTSMSEVESSAEGLVLTEWKIASTSNSEQKYKEAMNQVKLYSQGSLASLELRRYRYLVVVSEQQVDVQPDLLDDGVIYKHVNIAVKPLPPSKAARTTKKRS
jgi:hypothetical protein